MRARRRPLVVAILSLLPAAVPAANFTIPANTTSNVAQVLGNGDTGTVEAGATLAVSGDDAIGGGADDVMINNAGTITDSDEEAIKVDDDATVNNLTASSVIQAVDKEAIDADKNLVVDNYGTIESSNDEAILADGDAMITNRAGGVIRGGNEAIESDDNVTVDNAGTIVSTGNDAIQAVNTFAVTNSGTVHGQGDGAEGVKGANGTVVNAAGGRIIGQDNGIECDDGADACTGAFSVTNAAGALIRGETDTGIKVEANGANAVTIVNDGTIEGLGDDGIDADGTVTITNRGTITASGGVPPVDTSEAVTLGGGTLVNEAGGLIRGAQNGVYFAISASDDPNQSDDGLLVNAGTIVGENGYGVRFFGIANDTLTNTGTITGGGDPGGINPLGLVIDMADGDDTVNIGGGTISGGHVSGGDGDDTLNFALGAGNEFRFTHDFLAFETAHVLSGTLSLSGRLDASTRVHVADGARLALGTGARINAGDFDLDAGATLQVAVRGTRVGKVVATGTATLADGATVDVRTARPLSDGASYVLVEAGTLAVNVAAITVRDDSNLFDFVLGTRGGDLTLTVDQQNSFQSLGGRGSAGDGLDRIFSGSVPVSGALADLVAQLGQGSTDAIRQGARQAGPQNPVGTRQSALQGQGASFGAVGNRLSVARGPVGQAQAANAMAFAGGETGVSSGDVAATRGFWVRAFASDIDQGERAGDAGYQTDARGVTLGYDTELDAVVDRLGVFFAYAESQVDSKDVGADRLDVDQTSLGVYATTQWGDDRYLDLMTSYGVNRYAGSRVTLGAQTAARDFDGTQFGARAELGRYLAWDAYTVNPSIALQYVRVDDDAYRETGATAALNVDAADTESVQLELGVRFARRFRAGDTWITPEAGVAWAHEFNDTTTDVVGSFVGASTAGFTSAGVETDADTYKLGFGLVVETRDTRRFYLNYAYAQKDAYTAHTGMLTYRYTF